MLEKRKRAGVRKLSKLNSMLSRVACCSESWLQFREGKVNLGGGKKEIAEVNILLNVFM